MLSSEEIAFYRNLYRVFNDPTISDNIVKYAQMKQELALKRVRGKNDQYDQGYFNGLADAWTDIVNLRSALLEIMKQIG